MSRISGSGEFCSAGHSHVNVVLLFEYQRHPRIVLPPVNEPSRLETGPPGCTSRTGPYIVLLWVWYCERWPFVEG